MPDLTDEQAAAWAAEKVMGGWVLNAPSGGTPRTWMERNGTPVPDLRRGGDLAEHQWFPRTDVNDAIAMLEAWRKAGVNRRRWEIVSDGGLIRCELYQLNDRSQWNLLGLGCSTLGAAAFAAVYAAVERSDDA